MAGGSRPRPCRTWIRGRSSVWKGTTASIGWFSRTPRKRWPDGWSSLPGSASSRGYRRSSVASTAERVSHASDHRDPTVFSDRRVLVVGAGQSALETAALLAESGAKVEIAARSTTVYLARPAPLAPEARAGLHAGLRTRRGRPSGALPAGGGAEPGSPHPRRRPRSAGSPLDPARRCCLARITGGRFGAPPAGSRGRRRGRSSRTASGCASATGARRSSTASCWAPGIRSTWAAIPFLGPDLLRDVRTVDGYPVLGGLESSVPGLHSPRRSRSVDVYQVRSCASSPEHPSPRPSSPGGCDGPHLPDGSVVSRRRSDGRDERARTRGSRARWRLPGARCGPGLGRPRHPGLGDQDRTMTGWPGCRGTAVVLLVWPTEDDELRREPSIELARRHGLRGWVLFPTADATAAFVAREHAPLQRVLPAHDATVGGLPVGLRQAVHHGAGPGRRRSTIPGCWPLRPRAVAERYGGPFPVIVKPATEAVPEPARDQGLAGSRRGRVAAQLRRGRCGDRPRHPRPARADTRAIERSSRSPRSATRDARSPRRLPSGCVRYPPDFGRSSTFVVTVDDAGGRTGRPEGPRGTRRDRVGGGRVQKDSCSGSPRLLDINLRVWAGTRSPCGADWTSRISTGGSRPVSPSRPYARRKGCGGCA